MAALADMPTRPLPASASRFPAGGYERHRERMRQRMARQAHAGADIGAIPPVEDVALRLAVARFFERFCTECFPKIFYLPWSKDHLEVIGQVEYVARHGGTFAEAMPRGGGKTSLLGIAAPLWVTLNALRRYVVPIAATWPKAYRLLASLKDELLRNETLLALYPEVCYPIRRLEGIANRAAGQHLRGEPTGIAWSREFFVLPTVRGNPASGIIVQAAALTAAIRGLHYKTLDGEILRPDFVLVDDPQTDESARSLTQTQERKDLLQGAVLGLGGPDRKIAGIMATTVIQPGDLADEFLDTRLHPEWHGRRHKMLYSFPTDEQLWDRYAQIRADEMRNDGHGELATAFYREHREAMDAGAVAAWEHAKNPDELSAIQHAMNLKLDRGEATFMAEYQNEPLSDRRTEDQLQPAQLLAAVGGYERGVVPRRAVKLTCHVDVHDKLLYWLVVAGADNFSGWVIDYGCYPDQHRAYYTLHDARRCLGHEAPHAGADGAIYAGLKALLTALLAREFRAEAGGLLHLNLCLVDAGYKPDLVHGVIRELRSAALMPALGVGIRATDKPLSEYKRKPGETIGFHWYLPSVAGTRLLRHARVDTNFWKSFVHARFKAAKGDPGAWQLFGGRDADHRLLADHLTRSEFATRVEARGRAVYEWKLLPDKPDNHLLDNIVGAAAALSLCGIRLRDAAPDGRGAGINRRRRKVSYL